MGIDDYDVESIHDSSFQVFKLTPKSGAPNSQVEKVPLEEDRRKYIEYRKSLSQEELKEHDKKWSWLNDGGPIK